MSQFQVSLTGEPMIMVHRGWRLPSNPRRHSSINYEGSQHSPKAIPNLQQVRVPAVSKPRPERNAALEFAFVNVTEPGRSKDAKTKKLVRGHVVRDSTRKKRLMRRLNAERAASVGSVDVFVINARDEPATSDRNASLFSIPTPTQGLDPHPYLTPIIHHLVSIGDAMYPFVSIFRFNPISPAKWFDCALRDDALFHALLYTTSTYSGLMKGVTENKEAIVHARRSIALVRERLGEMEMVGDFGFDGEGTVRAVSCLAMSECLRGNHEGWKVHMTGMKQMVDMKGGVAGFSLGLQLKMHRADLMGATEYLVPAFFAEENSLPQRPTQVLRRAGERTTSTLDFLDVLPISDDLRNTLIYMHGLSRSVSRVLTSPTVLKGSQQISLMQHMYSLRYSLLPDYSQGTDFTDEASRTLDEVLRIGALLYVSETPKEFPNAVVGPLKMVRRLRELVMQIQMWNENEAGLVLWLLFFGGIAARKREHRVWFSLQIERMCGKLGANEWGDVRGGLEVLWWVEEIHEKSCRELWNEAMVVREAQR